MNVSVESVVPDKGPQGLESFDESPEYNGKGRRILGIVLLNALITPLTLGFYRFWGKTKLRRYVWNAIRFRGDPFEYTGRGMELLIGFIIATVVLAVLYGAYALVVWAWLRGVDKAVWQPVASVVFGAVFLFLIHYATFRARRYQLSRTLWRGIRFGQTGSAWRYAARAFGWVVLRVLTLNLIAPWAAAALQRYRIEHSWIGGSKLSFDAKGGPLFWRWVGTWLLFVPTLGLSYAWYIARQFRHFAHHTRLNNIAFESNLRGRDVVFIYLPYFVLLLVLLIAITGVTASVFRGITPTNAQDPTALFATILQNGWPQIVGALVLWSIAGRVLAAYFLVHRQFRLSCRTLRIYGAADFSAIAQTARDNPRFGEGLADALDIGGVGGV